MRIGLGGSVFGLRGGISNRGLGVGVGPFSIGTSFRRRRRRRRGRGSRGGGGDSTGVLIVGVIVVLVLVAMLMWPYMLSTYVAVTVFGAENPGTVRSVVGWVFEVPWILFVGLAVVAAIRNSSR